MIGRAATASSRDEALALRRRLRDRSRHLHSRHARIAASASRRTPTRVLGPWLVTADEIPDPGALDLQITVNGELRQQSNTRYMILGVAELIEMASSMYTLHPGDLHLHGHARRSEPDSAGDSIVATIAKIGTMAVAVDERPAMSERPASPARREPSSGARAASGRETHAY